MNKELLTTEKLRETFIPKYISRQSLLRHISCSASGRKICKGLCCSSPMASGRYLPDEISRLPKHMQDKLEHIIKGKIVKRYGDYYQVQKPSPDSPCPFIKYCVNHPENEAIQCLLYPFKISTNKKLYVEAHWSNLHCPNFRKKVKRGEEGFDEYDDTPEVWVAMEENLRFVYGDKFYEKLKKFMETNLSDDAFVMFEGLRIDMIK